MVLTLLLACPDTDDCRFNEDCALWAPRGQLCGFAYKPADRAAAEDHPGASCTEGERLHDPALVENIDVAVPSQDWIPPCPSQHTSIGQYDMETNAGGFMSCAATGSDQPVRPLDIQQGSACGLSSLFGSPKSTCMGVLPEEGCPEGFVLDFVIDNAGQWVDSACHGVDKGVAGARPISAELILFCVAEEGCAGPECLPEARASGSICGLHDGDTSNGDREDKLRDLVAKCPDSAPLIALEEQLWAVLEREPSCEGEPAGESCPEGLVRACMPDRSADCRESWVDESICWCTHPDTVQEGEYTPGLKGSSDDCE